MLVFFLVRVGVVFMLCCVSLFYLCLKIDIDKCSSNSHSCDVNAVCNNTRGSHTCTCKAGYSGDGKSCTGEFLNRNWIFQRVLGLNLPSYPATMASRSTNLAHLRNKLTFRSTKSRFEMSDAIRRIGGLKCLMLKDFYRADSDLLK